MIDLDWGVPVKKVSGGAFLQEALVDNRDDNAIARGAEGLYTISVVSTANPGLYSETSFETGNEPLLEKRRASYMGPYAVPVRLDMECNEYRDLPSKTGAISTVGNEYRDLPSETGAISTVGYEVDVRFNPEYNDGTGDTSTSSTDTGAISTVGYEVSVRFNPEYNDGTGDTSTSSTYDVPFS